MIVNCLAAFSTGRSRWRYSSPERDDDLELGPVVEIEDQFVQFRGDGRTKTDQFFELVQDNHGPAAVAVLQVPEESRTLDEVVEGFLVLVGPLEILTDLLRQKRSRVVGIECAAPEPAHCHLVPRHPQLGTRPASSKEVFPTPDGPVSSMRLWVSTSLKNSSQSLSRPMSSSLSSRSVSRGRGPGHGHSSRFFRFSNHQPKSIAFTEMSLQPMGTVCP